ncbi:unnamed protein product, partial [Discosporangium mesarthrocarpum]
MRLALMSGNHPRTLKLLALIVWLEQTHPRSCQAFSTVPIKSQALVAVRCSSPPNDGRYCRTHPSRIMHRKDISLARRRHDLRRPGPWVITPPSSAGFDLLAGTTEDKEQL